MTTNEIIAELERQVKSLLAEHEELKQRLAQAEQEIADLVRQVAWDDQ